MPGAQPVHDAVANRDETLEHHAQILTRSKNQRRVFQEVYKGRGKPKTAKEIVRATGLPQKAVLMAGQALVAANMVSREDTLEEGRKVIAFGKNEFCRHNRDKILRLADNPSRLRSLPTKRRPAATNLLATIDVKFPRLLIKTKFVTIDDIDSFAAVRSVNLSAGSHAVISEAGFKEGIAKIIGEEARFKDWGGEKSDLMTTRLLINGKRRPVAFAFKGPGLKSKLVPGKMGKNGDQCQRLFSEPAEVFLVHHWREIDPSVLTMMEAFAIAKSVTEMREVIYGLIDGQDSQRLMKAYPDAFP